MERIYPSVDELSTIETSIRCTEGDCTAVFKCKSNLNLHLARHHGNKDCMQLLMKSDTQKEYFCPSETCIYHSGKSFKNMKYLKQHFLKVHSSKNYKCSKCTLSYPTETLRKLHEDFCGISFKCLECPVKYHSYETLTTHSRRKGHKIFPKIQYKALVNGDVNACSRIICVVDAKPAERLILPKDFLTVNRNSQHEKVDNPVEKVCETACSSLVKSSNEGEDSKGTNKRKRKSKKMHTQTQTQKFESSVKSTAGTQTEVVSVHISTASSPLDASSKKSIKTQTITVTSSTRACNTSFDINNFASYEQNHLEVERNTLGTQTLSPNILSQAITSATAADVSTSTSPICADTADQSIGTGAEDLLQTYSYINDTNFGNIGNMEDMETQTDWLTNLDLLSNDVHSNNYTQTCDDILPPDLRFNNTHTQTVLNDILRSVGSQTNMRLNGGVFTNNETQTDSIFEELLQEINS